MAIKRGSFNVGSGPDPELTLSGDASGSVEFTDLGDATLSVTVADDSHIHDTRYYTETEADTLLSGKSDTSHSHSSFSGDVAFDTSTLYVDATNNRVGINKTNPTVQLDVFGGAHVEQLLTVGQGLTVDTSTLYVSGSNNRVGIGTSSPAAYLHVFAELDAEGIRLQYDDGDVQQGGYLSFYDYAGTRAGFVGYPGTGNLYLKNETSSGKLVLSTNNTDRLTIDSSGNVGIGKTSPSALLDLEHATQANIHVNDSGGTIGGNTNARLSFLAGGGLAGQVGFLNTTDGTMKVQNSVGDIAVEIASAGNVTFNLYDGNIGIGTTSPVMPIDFNAPGSSGARMRFEDGTTQTSGIQFTANGSAVNYSTQPFIGKEGLNDSDPLGIWHSGSWRMVVTSSGNVGINDITPSYTLDVNGTGRFTGDVITDDLTVNCSSTEMKLQGSIAGVQFITRNTGNRWVIYNSSSALRFWESSDRMVLTTSGLNVNGQISSDSIRTDNPSYTGSMSSPRWDTSFYVLQSQHWYGHSSSQTIYLGESGNPVQVRGYLNTDRGFRINNPSSGDGDDYAVGIMNNDWNCWADIFSDAWIGGTNGWGTFWAGSSGALYRRVSGDTNPNEFVFVGAGNKRFTFELNTGGPAFFDGTLTQNAYDYAEYFEWEDGNPNEEDRRGLSVVLVDGGYIRSANEDDDPEDIIGVVSGTAAVLGDAAMFDWQGKYVVDEWGSLVTEDINQVSWSITDENGEIERHSYDEDQIPEDLEVPEDASYHLYKRGVVSESYDPNTEYVPRDKRPEWGVVGLLGKVRVRNTSPKNPRWKYIKTVGGKELWLIR